MTNKIVDIEVSIDSEVDVVSTTGLTATGSGWSVEVTASSQQQAIFRVKGKDSTTHGLIAEVRSIDLSGPTTIVWTEDQSGTWYESSAFSADTDFRLEVQNENSAGPVPRGGGHFEVLDEGAGGP